MKNFLIKLSYCILGILIVIFILYIRVLRDALPTDIRRNLYAEGHYITLGIYSFLFLLFSYFTFILFKSLLLVYYEIGTEVKSNIVIEILGKLSKIYGESLDQLTRFICDITPIHKHLFNICVQLGLFLKIRCLTVKKLFTLVMIFHIIPKSIFLGAFITDVMVFHQFNYVYKVSFVMLIPLIEHGLHYFLIESFCKDNWMDLDDRMEIRGVATNNIITSEEYFKHCLVLDYKIESKRYPLEDSEFDFSFKKENPKHPLGFLIAFLLDALIPIATFNFFYTLKKQEWLMYYNVLFFLGYASIWLFMLVYSW